MDIVPIIPDQPDNIREPYNLALAKIIRSNDHKIINSYVRYNGSAITIELVFQNDTEMMEKLQAIKDYEMKERPDYKNLRDVPETTIAELVARLTTQEDFGDDEDIRYGSDGPIGGTL